MTMCTSSKNHRSTGNDVELVSEFLGGIDPEGMRYERFKVLVEGSGCCIRPLMFTLPCSESYRERGRGCDRESGIFFCST
jgi:hypothetical protein